MAKLAAFLERLAEKAAARDAAEGGAGAGLGLGSASSSLYSKQRYWDERYEAGAIGGAADKGELSNEWCAERIRGAARERSASNRYDGGGAGRRSLAPWGERVRPGSALPPAGSLATRPSGTSSPATSPAAARPQAAAPAFLFPRSRGLPLTRDNATASLAAGPPPQPAAPAVSAVSARRRGGHPRLRPLPPG